MMNKNLILVLLFFLNGLCLFSQKNNKLGIGLVNSTLITELNVLGDCNAPIVSTYANQLFYERHIKDSLFVSIDVFYFTDEINLPKEGFINKNDFEGFQFELGIHKRIYDIKKLSSDVGVIGFIAPNKADESTFKYYGAKVCHKFEYKMNELFGVFIRSSLTLTKFNFDTINSSHLNFFPVDAFGFNIYF